MDVWGSSVPASRYERGSGPCALPPMLKGNTEAWACQAKHPTTMTTVRWLHGNTVGGLNSLQVVPVRKRREAPRHGTLVPERHGGHVILKREVAAAAAPAQGLHCDPQALLETDGIRDVPAIEAEARLGGIEPVRPDDLRHTRVRGGELLVVLGPRTAPGTAPGAGARPRARDESVGAAEVVFRAGPADGWVLAVVVHEELDLTFPPPAGVVHAPRHVRADVLTLALHAVQERDDVLVGNRVHPAELGVEVCRV